ncbi:MAG: hypothetical protein HFE75_13340 [Firmicutes bacterium]|jgi:hypothetical protein|nr:hypothetical protein [Bacillota bacterium]
MSRNKWILLMIVLAGVYFALPNEGVYRIIKMNARMVLPYIMITVIIYLIFTINLLKRAWRKVDAHVNDENTVNFAKLMNITFDVKRMLGPTHLINLYNKINFSSHVSPRSKELLYDAMRRKRLDVPPPGQGADIDAILARPKRTPEEIRAARIEAASKAKQKAKRKKKKK